MTEFLFKPAILIPVYNHELALKRVIERVLVIGCPVLLVDDGSGVACRRELEQLNQSHQQISLLRLPENGGKGAAVKAGVQWLYEHGFSHAMQVDADGQHNIDDVKSFLLQAKKAPNKLIAGYPQYDETVPKVRLYARYLTHVWVWINTLSFSIVDSMCGFRVYPVKQMVELLEKSTCGNRMDFDTEFIVRWAWSGWEIVNLPTRVHYPIDGVSHFRLWRDNVLISWMHTRLFFGMLQRLPTLLKRKFIKVNHVPLV